ncbi:MAG: tetratricopeptide repeat protein [Alphaproteobacteria bacterium]|nr:tetratricopeptide repeat protein [Alphaproteobacteria bacterium]
MRRALVLAALLALVTPARADGLADLSAATQAAQRQDWGRAIRLDTRALTDRTLSPQDRATAYNARGSAYYRNKQYDRALADYSAAIKLSPQCGTCYNNRGMARNEKSDYDGAIADFTAALKYEPKSWEVYLNRGIAWYHKNDNDRAIGDYTTAIKLKPDCGPCFHDRGMAWQDKGDMAKANDDLNTADQFAH